MSSTDNIWIWVQVATSASSQKYLRGKRKCKLFVLITPSSISYYICSGCNSTSTGLQTSFPSFHKPSCKCFKAISWKHYFLFHNEMLTKLLPSHGSSYSLCVLHRLKSTDGKFFYRSWHVEEHKPAKYHRSLLQDGEDIICLQLNLDAQEAIWIK